MTPDKRTGPVTYRPDRKLQPGMLTRDEERELTFRWKEHRDQRAIDRLILAHMPLVKKIAKRYAKFMPIEDAIQEGCIGLTIAAQRFDPMQSVRLSTFAQWWVRAQISAAVLLESTVKIGQTKKSKSAFYRGEREFRMVSIEMPVAGSTEESPLTLGMCLECPAKRPDEAVEIIDTMRNSLRLKSALERLNPREREILEARWLAEDTQTLEVLGAIYGISKERIRQIEAAAIEKVRQSMLKPPSNRSRAAATRYQPRWDVVDRKLAEAARA